MPLQLAQDKKPGPESPKPSTSEAEAATESAGAPHDAPRESRFQNDGPSVANLRCDREAHTRVLLRGLWTAVKGAAVCSDSSTSSLGLGTENRCHVGTGSYGAD